jgi:hypothetical protein
VAAEWIIVKQQISTAGLSPGLMPLAFLSIACVSILDPVTRGRSEAGRIADPALRGSGDERRRS